MILNNYYLGSGSGSSHSGSGGARITDKKNIVSKSGENTPPPPLPSTAPPIHRAPLRGRKVGETMICMMMHRHLNMTVMMATFMKKVKILQSEKRFLCEITIRFMKIQRFLLK